MQLRTYVYVDGFNLYYRALKGTSFKWLDLKRLAELVLGRKYRIHCIKYFTARVSSRVDRDQPKRQQTYLRALATVPEIEIIYGKFLVNTVTLPLERPLADGTRWARVLRTEEKGSDVNLASHLVHDAHLKLFDAAAVISSDTDLVEPIRLVTSQLGVPICLIPPNPEGSRSLKAVASEVREFDANRLRRAQFPDVVRAGDSNVTKPERW